MIAPKIAGNKLSATFMGFDRATEDTIERMSANLTGTLKPGLGVREGVRRLR